MLVLQVLPVYPLVHAQVSNAVHDPWPEHTCTVLFANEPKQEVMEQSEA